MHFDDAAPNRGLQDQLAALTWALASLVGNETLKKQWGLRPGNYFPVRPVIDGHMLHMEPLPAIEKHLAKGAAPRAVLLGFNAEEMRFYLVPNGEIDRIDEARDQSFMDDIGGSTHTGRVPRRKPTDEHGRCAAPHTV